MALIACSRMYNVTPRVRQAWDSLFAWVSQASGVELEIIEHPAPARLDELWGRPDIGCVFMCGWPFSRSEPQPQLIAAPCPLGRRYDGKPRYFTDLIVRRDRGYQTLKDTFGGRIAWTADASHSGFNAPRHHLLAFRTSDQPDLYSESIGPLLTPIRSLASIVDSVADIAPMDSYALDLIRLHEPERISEIMVIDSTAAAPFPPLVASNNLASSALENLRRAFLIAGSEPTLIPLLATLSIGGFTAIKAEAYNLALMWEQDALLEEYLFPG
jgi:ABC-type phosphate/phosphonate transport system substrate-binding protein